MVKRKPDNAGKVQFKCPADRAREALADFCLYPVKYILFIPQDQEKNIVLFRARSHDCKKKPWKMFQGFIS